MKRHLITYLILLTLCLPMHAAGLGEWTLFHAYNDLTRIVPASKAVYALSAGALFSYNAGDESLTEYNITNLLNDSEDITDICWNGQTQHLVIAYANGNIDLLDTRDNSVRNFSAIADEITTRSKTIKDILCHGSHAYIVMQYGVITLNTARQEFGDTYRFTTGSASFTGAWVENDSLFLEADRTLDTYGSTVIRGKLTDNLLDKSKWHGVDAGRAGQVKASIAKYRQARTVTEGGKDNLIADTYRNCHWGADKDGGLMKYAMTDDNAYTPQWQKGVKPDGPASNDFYTIKWENNRLYTLSRGWRTNIDSYEPGVIQVYNPDAGWSVFQTPAKEDIGIDFIATSDIAIDPRDTSHVMVGAKSGLYEFYAGRFVRRWSKANSPIKSFGSGTSETYQLVLGTIYDASGTLWALNAMVSDGLLKLTQPRTGGSAESESRWETFTHSQLQSTPIISNPVFDGRGRLWFINLDWGNTNFFSYDPAGNILTEYHPYYNQDGAGLYNQNDSFLRDINIDAEGNVWLCGTNGICYLPARETGTGTDVMTQYKVPRNDGTGLADYLLSTVDASCIIFDSAGRKYVGTQGSGIYVISADNNTEVQNYNTSNCNIISDNVYRLALDEKTGMLYCSTDRGLCAVRTDGITVPASLDKNNIRVYPNPVRPDYTGMITFEGLTVGADIKITTATGAIVHTGRSTSALYQWDGCDLSGNRCASGVYNVLIATEDGSEGCVAKVAMVK